MANANRLSEAIVILLLSIACLAFAARARAALPFHLALLVAFIAIVTFARSPAIVRSLAVVVVLMTLYQSLAEPAFAFRGHAFDPQLASIDRALTGGYDPALVVARYVTPRNLEAFSFIYGVFIPYLWLSILLGCIGRPDDERARFIIGLSITYALAYLGYLFVPSRGPVEYYQFAAPLHGGRFHALVLESVQQTGGNHGAFPSLHVAASTYLCIFDLRRHLLRGLTYLPIVLLIAVSTVFLRYHYVVDIVTGFAIAFVAAAASEARLRA